MIGIGCGNGGMMAEKTQIINRLKDEFGPVGSIVGRAQRSADHCAGPIEALSIKDIVAHLTTWQAISVRGGGRAARQRTGVCRVAGGAWTRISDTDLDRINAWIYESHRAVPLGGDPPGMERKDFCALSNWGKRCPKRT